MIMITTTVIVGHCNQCHLNGYDNVSVILMIIVIGVIFIVILMVIVNSVPLMVIVNSVILMVIMYNRCHLNCTDEISISDVSSHKTSLANIYICLKMYCHKCAC